MVFFSNEENKQKKVYSVSLFFLFAFCEMKWEVNNYFAGEKLYFNSRFRYGYL
jgi:hypothetical protein